MNKFTKSHVKDAVPNCVAQFGKPFERAVEAVA